MICMAISYLSRLQVPRKVAHGIKESMEFQQEGKVALMHKYQQVRLCPAFITLHEKKKKEREPYGKTIMRL